MSYHAVVLQHGGFDPAVARSWDALPPKRGVQADFYDSHAWLSSWSHAARAVVAAGLRVPAVLDCGRPVALLPLEGRSRRRPAGLGHICAGVQRESLNPIPVRKHCLTAVFGHDQQPLAVRDQPLRAAIVPPVRPFQVDVGQYISKAGVIEPQGMILLIADPPAASAGIGR